MEKRINITPILETVFGISEISKREHIQRLIKALRENSDINIFDTKRMAELMQSIQKVDMDLPMTGSEETNTKGKMTPHLAVGIANGLAEAESAEQVIEAWQYLIDTGLAWKLSGWYARTAENLIERGACQKKQSE